MKPIKAEFFINNRARLRLLFTGTAPIVLTAAGLLQQNGDMTLPFRQDSSFWYFTGIDEPGIILVMEKNKEYLILPNRPRFNDVAEGALDLEKLSASSGIKEILDNQEGWRRLNSRLKRLKHVAVLPALPSYIEDHAFYTNPARAHLSSKIKESNADISFLDLRRHIIKLRLIKQPEEIESIKAAIKITSDTISKIAKNVSKYKFEYEVDAFLLSEFRRHNSTYAFTNVVSSGKNSTAIHYGKGDDPLNSGDLLLVDVGAEVNHYAADITRVIPISGKMSKRQQQVFDSVSEVQEHAYSLLKPGVVYKEYESQIEHFMGEKLRELGLISTIDRDSVRKYFPHLTSHFLGLDTHDIGEFTTVFRENMVLTVEPGIYIHEEGLGIRLEDDVIITKTGIKNLSDNLPSSFN